MIPKIIHYCWFGRGEMPELVNQCIASWHRFMPDYEYKLWNEDSFAVNSIPYTCEAYAANKYAFVSDYVRLWVLEQEGGIYLDTDVMVFKSFDGLLINKAFAGFEGSKHFPMGTCVMATEAHGEWVADMLDAYKGRHFQKADGSFDMTTNVQFISDWMCKQGFVQNGMEQDFKDLHVYPVEYFCPRQTTGEYFCTENTFCDHLGIGSWAEKDGGWKAIIKRIVGPTQMTRLIKIKRKLFG